ncbi:hypothetical protein N8000_05010 [Rhodospirillales bacterium]|nr:hypothetical protein [Rhodospirillales bacterium]
MSEGMRSIDFSNISVLVAEYNNYMRQTIRSILRTFNIGDIIEMQNPDDAWDMFCATPPDVVFADWAPALMVWAF